MWFKLISLFILTIATLRYAIIATITGSNKATDKFIFSLFPTVTMWLIVMGVI